MRKYGQLYRAACKSDSGAYPGINERARLSMLENQELRTIEKSVIISVGYDLPGNCVTVIQHQA